MNPTPKSVTVPTLFKLLLAILGLRDARGAKRCPFCRSWPSATLTDDMAQMTCPNCYGAGPAVIAPNPHTLKPTKLIEAIRLWNRRL